jgi:hypothetical protein
MSRAARTATVRDIALREPDILATSSDPATRNAQVDIKTRMAFDALM